MELEINEINDLILLLRKGRAHQIQSRMCVYIHLKFRPTLFIRIILHNISNESRLTADQIFIGKSYYKCLFYINEINLTFIGLFIANIFTEYN